jgi:hypothetical protein
MEDIAFFIERHAACETVEPVTSDTKLCAPGWLCAQSRGISTVTGCYQAMTNDEKELRRLNECYSDLQCG